MRTFLKIKIEILLIRKTILLLHWLFSISFHLVFVEEIFITASWNDRMPIHCISNVYCLSIIKVAFSMSCKIHGLLHALHLRVRRFITSESCLLWNQWQCLITRDQTSLTFTLLHESSRAWPERHASRAMACCFWPLLHQQQPCLFSFSESDAKNCQKTSPEVIPRQVMINLPGKLGSGCDMRAGAAAARCTRGRWRASRAWPWRGQ